jgi:adenylate cyclase
MPNNILPGSLKKRVPAILAAGLTVIFFLLAVNRIALTDPSFLTAVEWRWVDVKFRLRGERPGGKEVVIVGMDDKTLDKLGSARVFQRSNLAKLVTKLAEAEPKAIGFDINFPEPDVSNPDNDRQFAEAIQMAKSVVLGVWLDLEPTTGPKRPLEDLDQEMSKLVQDKGVFAAENTQPGSKPPMAFFLGARRRGNLPELTRAAISFGFVNFHADSDGRLRYQPQLIEYGGRLYPSLDIQVLRKYLNASSPIVDYGPDGNIQMVEVGSYRIPTDQFGRFLIDYTGKRGTYPTVSIVDVMEGTIDRNVFKDTFRKRSTDRSRDHPGIWNRARLLPPKVKCNAEFVLYRRAIARLRGV